MSETAPLAQRFELLVFDWDGTLADSLGHIVKSIRHASEALGFPARDDTAIRNIIGLGLEEALERLFPGIEPAERQNMAQSYRDFYLRSTQDSIVLFPSAAQTIMDLHAAGHQLAVATGKSRRGLNRALQDSGLQTYFHETRCADETFSKPHPQMLEEIMSCLLIEPDKVLMIGDSEHDLQMAKNAGVASAAVSYGAQSREHLLNFKPLTCFNSLQELPAWLAGHTY